MTVCWFSAGVSSFIAAYLARDKLDKVIYCHIDNQHDDTMRFVKDCEIKGVWLDELDPTRGRLEDEVMGDCSIACQILWGGTENCL